MRLPLLFIAFLMTFYISFAQTTERDFSEEWKQVTELSEKGQPKSALEIVSRIYEAAKKEKNDPQTVKAVIERIRLLDQFRENPMENAIRDLQKEILTAGTPVRQILTSLLGSMYETYFQSHRWMFEERTTLAGDPGDSIGTWDLNTIRSRTISAYLSSLDDVVELKKIPTSRFSIILIKKEEQPETLLKGFQEGSFRPFLYDLLAWRAIGYFTHGDEGKNIPAGHFRISGPEHFLPAKEWLALPAVPRDTASNESMAMILFRDLTAFHLADPDPRVLISIENERVAYAHQRGGFPSKDSLYIAALYRLIDQYAASPWSTDLSSSLASFLQEQGRLYMPLSGNAHKWQLKEALEVCRTAISRHPRSEGALRCSGIEKQILQKQIQITTEKAVIPDRPFPGSVTTANCSKIFLRIIINDQDITEESMGSMTRSEQMNYLASLPVFRSWSVDFPQDGDHQQHTGEFSLHAVPAGRYILIASATEDIRDTGSASGYTNFASTRISYINRHENQKTFAFYVLDRETGVPLKGAKVETYFRKYNTSTQGYDLKKVSEHTADDNGFVSVPGPVRGSEMISDLIFRYRNETFRDNIYFGFRGYDDDRTRKKEVITTHLFTDRSIYRPGQTVYFKGISVRWEGKQKEPATGKTVTVTFLDVNSNKVDEKSFTTNEYGSFNGSFTIPSSGLRGRMSITTSTGSVAFSVEEYKRPTFEVTFDPIEGNYRLADSIRFTGKAMAYAGNAISGAQVRYRIFRVARFPFREIWWIPVPMSPETEITSGITTTDAEGNFSVSFFALPDYSIDEKQNPVFRFTISADVTDLNGETQQAEESVSVGYTSLILTAGLPDNFNLKKDTAIIISAENLNGRKTPAKVQAELQRLSQPGRVIYNRKWNDPDVFLMNEKEFRENHPNAPYRYENNPARWDPEKTVLLRTMDTGTDSVIGLSDLKDLQPGMYRLVLKSTDPAGKPVTMTRNFLIFDPGAKTPPVNSPGMFAELKATAEPGENAEFLLGSGEKDVNVLYEVLLPDSTISRQWIKLDRELKKIVIPVKEEYRGGFSVNFVFVRNNQPERINSVVRVPFSNKKLDISISSFRDRMNPGEKEEWKIKITGQGSKSAGAGLMATMYDMSLDALLPHSWSFNIWNEYTGVRPWESGNSFTTTQFSGFTELPSLWVPEKVFEEIDWFHYGYERRGIRGVYQKNLMMDEAQVTESKFVPPSPVLSETSGVIATWEPSKGKPAAIPVKTRSDFRETVFFYPEIITDSSGTLILKFTAPEALTRWKMMGIAHTPDLKTGYVEKEVITQKDLMVFPNAPRFFRQGDTVVFSAKIVNLAGRALNGEATIEITDPLGGGTPGVVAESNGMSATSARSFNIPAGGSSLVSWKLIIPVDAALSMLRYRITAQSGSFSDGEERMIPVLTNRMMVTESLPMPVRGAGSFDFTLEKLKASSGSSSLKNYRLTLEFATNPAWYAVQALPVLDDPKYPSADGIFNAFYANSLAMHIANSDPSVKTIFESWKRISPEALLSNLEKNQDLKTAVLEETPWVLEAKNESQNKQRLGELFDQENLESKLVAGLARLKTLQRPEGGWSWFEGMKPNTHTTREIVTGFGRLKHLGVRTEKDPQISSMIRKAIAFLDREMVKDYEWIMKNSKKPDDENHLSGDICQYLYARSFFMKEVPPEKKTGTALDFYKKQAEKYWLKNDIYFQGMIALALNRLGSKTVPGMILTSLSEKALHSPEMGMYWAQNHGYYWYQAPVETQSLLIEAYEEVAGDTKSADEMKIWLLKQKQTTAWKTGRATADACYALLMRGTSLLSEDQEATFTIGKETIDPSKIRDNSAEPGTGYFRISWNGAEITPAMATVRVNKTGKGIAWGALYWQYFEDLDRITPAKTPLKLEKKVFIERNTPSGPVLEAVTEKNILSTGDRLKIRIVITADRDLEYVHMKDMRAPAFEPVMAGALSGYRYQDGLGYYQSTGDAATNFFFDYLPGGTYVFEYPLLVNASGNYSNGITTIQCMYAPEFGAHSEGIRLEVK